MPRSPVPASLHLFALQLNPSVRGLRAMQGPSFEQPCSRQTWDPCMQHEPSAAHDGKKDWVKASSDLAQDRRAWSASVLDVVNSTGDAGSPRVNAATSTRNYFPAVSM